MIVTFLVEKNIYFALDSCNKLNRMFGIKFEQLEGLIKIYADNLIQSKAINNELKCKQISYEVGEFDESIYK